jgi:hypothetical protein
MTGLLFLLCLAATPQEETVSDVVRQLGDEAPPLREAAVQKLKARGRKVLPELNQLLTEQADPEVRARIGLILRQLTQVRWYTDLSQAEMVAASEKKPLLVFSTKGPLDGFV